MASFKASLCLIAVFLAATLGSATANDWRWGRATFYGIWWSLHTGSCGYGNIDYWQGTGWDVAAIPDAHYEYNWSCGYLENRHHLGRKLKENNNPFGEKKEGPQMLVLDERYETSDVMDAPSETNFEEQREDVAEGKSTALNQHADAFLMDFLNITPTRK
ncbi:hypothetical protein BSKO_05052 [Bryopsis sp. KO-2023]|nr:hypothetical protein BSKO_05052 [Bryopsis sp. KO-2023]